MHLQQDHIRQLEEFCNQSKFNTHGALITDLDGTAVHEFNGRTIIHESVDNGLRKIQELGRPVVINTLRFPLSVIRTFARDWYDISQAAIPVVLLNGSQLGYIAKRDDEFAFDQLKSFCLPEKDILAVMENIKRLSGAQMNDFILFYYPEDWTKGEIIWTPEANKIPYLQEKYKSASSVIATDIAELSDELLSSPVCMIFLLLEIPHDQLMAYQHTKRSNFITREGVDKLYGTKEIALLLEFEPEHSIGAGDSEMDNFLNGVGLSIHVGNPNLPFKGKNMTMKLPGYSEFGDLLHRFAGMQHEHIK